MARDIGTALGTGAVLAAVSFFAQLNFEDRGYLNSLTMAGDLQGFDDLGHDLGNASLSNRSMQGAQLIDARMDGANLAYSDLSGARLDGAHLQGASLFHTAFDDAVLSGADLQDANLRGATFYHSTFPADVALKHAKADLNTCWPLAMVAGSEDAGKPEPDDYSRAMLRKLAAAKLKAAGVDSEHDLMTQTIGSVCAADDRRVPEGRPAPVADPYRIRVCRDGSLVRVTRTPDEADHAVTCERPS